MKQTAIRFSTRATLYASYITLLVLLLIVAGMSLYALSKADKAFSGYVQGPGKRAMLASQLDAAVKDRAVALRNLVLIADVQARAGQQSVIDAADRMVIARLDQWRQSIHDDTDVGGGARELFASVESIEKRYAPVARKIAEHVLAGEDDTAIRMIAEQCTPLLQELTVAIDGYQKFIAQQAAERIEVNTADYRAQRNLLVLVIAISVLFAVVLGQSITRRLLRALGAEPDDLNRIARQVADGDLRHSDSGNVRADSVLGSLRNMQRNLREMALRISASSQSVATSSQALSGQTQQSLDGVANSLLEIEQIVTAIHEMAATVQDVARSAETAAAAADEADHEARQSQDKTVHAVSLIDGLARDIDHSADAMQRLKAESSNIGTVLDVIKSVADQTNLLALNAAIEAARAGEAGRGFAVVADEVRNLARRTRDATSEIEGLIISLQRIADESAQSMQNCQASSEQAVSSSSQVGDAVLRIVDMIERINGMNQQIAAAAEQQSAVAEQISQNIIAVRDNASQAGDAMRHCYQESDGLARTSEALKEDIARFQL
ncbi:methyl-accepting chemotaxis protein [Stutzerimonas kirkiae]|uniref:Methyl-accepting chemotaxis protein n=1 Tax=Stutzerimonas kirkiae TaxID=2211392 RepID=A0A4Q9R7H0_9GAMM|nr:methyl-accepting chemotaxis protein [Stutzerimonas kirkiae]TBU96513.1 methyl-accepting chemotaxis protein [Stutzerimonas kirkiae]TBV02204.1 methyl-accepting chemotaxis protein [Stutzerimonas kirkiae]TBV08873.1 methyl-accepting chemotaxis protein [Stutzerimonas kirkiae]